MSMYNVLWYKKTGPVKVVSGSPDSPLKLETMPPIVFPKMMKYTIHSPRELMAKIIEMTKMLFRFYKIYPNS